MSQLQRMIDARDDEDIDGNKYQWTQLYGSKAVQKFVNGREKVREVLVKNHPHIGYKTRLRECQEAFEYENGDILLLGTFSTFAGTFASHDDIEVHIYALTPKKK